MDDLKDLLPPAPPPAQLPRSAAHRAALLAALRAEATAGGGSRRRPAAQRWLIPAGAAAAVIAIAGAVALVRLAGPAGPTQAPVASQVPPPGATRQAGPTTSPTEPGPADRTAGPPGHQLTIPWQWQVPTAGISQVVISSGSGAVAVTAGRANAEVNAIPAYTGDPPTVFSVVHGSVLTITARCPRSAARGCQVVLTVAIPPRLSVTVAAQLGDVAVTGAAGPVQVTAQLGNVALRQLSGPLRADAQLGSIDGSGLRSRTTRLTAQLGRIDAAFVAPPALVTATDGQGPVTIRVPGGVAYRVSARAQLGSASVSVPRAAGSAHVIRASSQLGSVTVTTS